MRFGGTVNQLKRDESARVRSDEPEQRSRLGWPQWPTDECRARHGAVERARAHLAGQAAEQREGLGSLEAGH